MYSTLKLKDLDSAFALLAEAQGGEGAYCPTHCDTCSRKMEPILVAWFEGRARQKCKRCWEFALANSEFREEQREKAAAARRAAAAAEAPRKAAEAEAYW